MNLYNTLSRKVEEFTPLRDGVARIYSCGPTVYDHAHIGNLSAYIFADTLRRATQLATGSAPKHVMNYTDVDDKTIRRSHERYPDMDPRDALHKLTSDYIDIFLQDMRRIGNDVDTVTFVRATDRIDGMKQLVTQLHRAGFAYIADDGVYFSIQAYRDSGKTYGQLLEITTSNTSEQRIQNDEYDKDNVHDFALWKKQKDGEPAWEFSLDGQDLTGRPGWHIECSVMSRDELGQPFDIHTGGVDLIFPHHENEIAQSTALEDNPTMARFFVHNEHILVDGKKMSKSANNFYTLQDIIDKGYDPLAFRLLVLQAHYRSQVHFSWENLDAAQNRLETYRAMADLRWQPVDYNYDDASDQNKLKLPLSDLTISRAKSDILKALSNDLDTPQLLSTLSEFERQASSQLVSRSGRENFIVFLQLLDSILGLNLMSSNDITDAQKQRIKQREEARSSKDWATSDRIRDDLLQQNIGLRDTEHGPIWYRL